MAKQRRNLLASSLSKKNNTESKDSKPELTKKVPVKKKSLVENEKIEKATKKIHSKKTAEKSIRFTMDIPEEVYYEIKMVMIKKKIKTMKDYFLMLAKKDRS